MNEHYAIAKALSQTIEAGQEAWPADGARVSFAQFVDEAIMVCIMLNYII